MTAGEPARGLPWLSTGLLAALHWSHAEAWAPALRDAMGRCDIATPSRAAAFLAQTGHESGGGAALAESLNYSPAGLMATWPVRFPRDVAMRLGRISGRLADQQAIADRAYGSRMGNRPAGSGDGWAFRGRGLIQVTGRTGYTMAASWFGVRVDEVAEILETRTGAALAAARWWEAHNLNRLADIGEIDAISRIVNCGPNAPASAVAHGAVARRRRYTEALAAIESAVLAFRASAGIMAA